MRCSRGGRYYLKQRPLLSLDHHAHRQVHCSGGARTADRSLYPGFSKQFTVQFELVTRRRSVCRRPRSRLAPDLRGTRLGIGTSRRTGKRSRSDPESQSGFSPDKHDSPSTTRGVGNCSCPHHGVSYCPCYTIVNAPVRFCQYKLFFF